MRLSPLSSGFLSSSIFSALVPILVLGLGSTASADRFDSAAKGARAVHTADGLTALFWSQEAHCSKAKGDFLRRQCKGVRDVRRAKVVQQTYVVDVAGPAIQVELDAAKKLAKVTLRACVACEAKGAIVVGNGAHKVTAKDILAASLASETKAFKKLAQAEHWSKYVGTRLRAQLIVKVPASAEHFKAAGRSGYKVKVVGYRLYDPCQGEVVASKPSSTKGPVQVSACDDEPAMASHGPTVAKKPVIEHPDRLTTSQIKTAMKGVSALADECYDAYQIEGMATFKMVIGGNGKLAKAEQHGDFKGTPTGICLDKAMKTVTFPKSKTKTTPITYPMMLQ